MDKIYVGCFYKNADGTNKIIAEGDRCFAPTDKCFWKDPNDVKDGAKTRSRANDEATVSFQAADKYREDKVYLSTCLKSTIPSK